MSDQASFIAALSNVSTTREKIPEHRFVAEVTSALWARGIFDFAVSHSKADRQGNKGRRPALRIVPRTEFRPIPSWSALTALLFALPEAGSMGAEP